jgi:hypothetical protein
MDRKPKLRIVGSGRDPKLRLVADSDAAPLEGLCESARLSAAVDKLQRHLVGQARNAGRTWTEIGASLGIRRQAAWERFSAPPD